VVSMWCVSKTFQPVEKVQVISSFYPWRAKLEHKWQHGRKICSSIVDFFNRLLRFLPISRAIGQGAKKRGVRAPSLHFTGFGRSENTTPVSSLVSLILTLDFLFVGHHARA